LVPQAFGGQHLAQPLQRQFHQPTFVGRQRQVLIEPVEQVELFECLQQVLRQVRELSAERQVLMFLHHLRDDCPT
jgi:hypothetical protein